MERCDKFLKFYLFWISFRSVLIVYNLEIVKVFFKFIGMWVLNFNKGIM